MPSSRTTPDDAADFSGIRILMVEDEPLLAELMEQTFSDAGAKVIGPATTIKEALGLLDTEYIDLAVLDAKLRGQSVYPLAAALHRRAVPFAFVTGYRELADLQTNFPDAPVLEKPTGLARLQDTLFMLLRNRRAADQPSSTHQGYR